MAVALPPINEESWQDHNKDAAERADQQARADLAQAQAAQEAQEAARAADRTRQAQQAWDAAVAPQRQAERAVTLAGTARDLFAQATAPLRRATAARAPSAPAMPVQPGGAGLPSGGPSPDEASALERVYRDARAAGLDEEGARVAQAVARTEEGYGGVVGDLDHNPLGAAGTFQLNFGGGQGNTYARARGISDRQARDELARDPHSANAWALSGYLGAAIREGQAKGLHGAELATYAQRFGQRSVSPERAGAYYGAAGPTAPAMPGTAARAVEPLRRAEAVGQFEQGLPYDEAAAICGPVAAVAFSQANGRNPDLGEARRLARQVGWTAAGGMNGVANEQRLLEAMGVASRLDTSPDFGEIAADAASGNPVIVSTGRHYYYISGYDDRTGRLYVGKTGTSRKGGASWMTPQQIVDLDGGINGVLYVDSPRSPTPSVAASDVVSQSVNQPLRADSVRSPGPSTPGGAGAAGEPADGRLQGETAPFPSGPGFEGLPGGLDEGPYPGALPPAEVTAPVGGSVEPLPGRAVGGSWAEAAGVPGRPATLGDFPAFVGDALRGAVGGPSEDVRARLRASAQEITAPQERATEALGRVAEEQLPIPPGSGRAFVESAAQETLGMIGPGKGDLPQAGAAVKSAAQALAAEAERAATAPTSSTVFARFWNRARNVIESQGEAGQELGRGLRAWRDSAERLAGEWTAGMPTVRALSRDEFRQFVAAAEGKAQAGSERIAKAVEEWDAVRTDAYNRAKEAGLDIGRLEDYWPHVFEEGTFSGKGWTQAIDHLVGTGQATSRADAAQKLRYAQDVRRNRRYGNLEMARELDLPDYRTDPGVLFGQGGYLEAAANRIAQVAHFGQKDADALALIDRIGRAGGDARAVKDLFDISVGARRYDPDLQRISGALRGANTVASLGLSAITNAGQWANTATVVGLGPTARNVWRALRSPEAREEAIRAGVTLDNVVQDVREGTGLASRALGRITAPGFGAVERFNRTLAFHAGVSYAEDMAAKAAQGDRSALAALERLGLKPADVAERGVLSDAERITAGRNVVERTQFKVSPQDLPQWASHPLGKLVAQFKTFSYNQSAFLGREIVQPALRGDLRPLARFMAAGLVSGAVTTETRNLLQFREPEQDPVKRILQYYQAAGGLGLAGDVLRITSPLVNINADRLDPDRVVTQAVGTVLGPTVGTGIEALSGIAQATRGNPTPLERSLLRRVPVVGTTLQNLLVPYRARPETAPTRTRSATPPKPPSPPRPPAPPRPPQPPRPGGR